MFLSFENNENNSINLVSGLLILNHRLCIHLRHPLYVISNPCVRTSCDSTTPGPLTLLLRCTKPGSILVVPINFAPILALKTRARMITGRGHAKIENS